MINYFINKITTDEDEFRLFMTNNYKDNNSNSFCTLFEDKNYSLIRKYRAYLDGSPCFYIKHLKINSRNIINFIPQFDYDILTHTEKLNYYYLPKKNLKSSIVEFIDKVKFMKELRK